MINKIRPLYTELQGYLSQAPDADKRDYFDTKNVWIKYNNTIDELNEATGKDFSSFKVQITYMPDWGEVVSTREYRSNLSGLISRLYGEYFNDEVAPFSGIPRTIIQQNQQQSQNVHVQILLEMQSIIDKKLQEVKDDKEKGFLEKIKASLSQVKSISELMNLILSSGAAAGITMQQIIDLLK